MKPKFNFIKLLIALFSVFVCLVIVYQIYCYFYVSVATEYATLIECEDTETVSGYFLRDESVIKSENSKYIDITVNSGEKVSNGGVIANVYSSEDSAKTQSQIRDLQLRIDEIKSVISAASGYNTGSEYKNEIKKDAINISRYLSQGDISEAFAAASDFTSNVIKSKISKGEITNYTDKLKELENQMSVLVSSSAPVASYITAANSGYFVEKADGLENQLSLALADDITAESFQNIEEKCTQNTAYTENYIGKLVSGSIWRVCFKTESEKFDKTDAGSTLYIRIPSVTDDKIKCTVSSISKDGNYTYVVLESNVISGDILAQRSCQIDVVIDTYSGLRVDKNAIRKVEDVEGVYIRSNGILKYRKVNILYISSTYVVVEYDVLDTSGLQAYDEVVVKGSNLYEGKVVA